MTEREIEILAARVLETTFPRAQIESITAETRLNHADEDSVFVTVRFKPGVGGTQGRVTGEALVALRRALREQGEDRFPYLLYTYPDDPPPYADDVVAAE